MAAQKGLDVLIKVGDGAATEAFTAAAGIRSTNIAFNAETVDVTSLDNTNRWRELLAGAGIKSASVSGSGVFTDAAEDETLRSNFFDGTIGNFELVIPDFGTIEGAFQITALEYAGDHNGEATYSMTLDSAGDLSWTAAS